MLTTAVEYVCVCTIGFSGSSCELSNMFILLSLIYSFIAPPVEHVTQTGMPPVDNISYLMASM